jgi:hypothetical protein
VKTDRLQLTLIANLRPMAQPLPPHVRAKCIELIARMLVGLVRPERVTLETAEVRDECR